VTGVISRPRRSGRIEVIAPEETLKKSAVIKVRDPYSSTDDELQFDSDGFVIIVFDVLQNMRSRVAWSKPLFRRHVGLYDTKQVSFCVGAVGDISNARNSLFWLRNGTSCFHNLFQ
jgi:hypothetical protein